MSDAVESLRFITQLIKGRGWVLENERMKDEKSLNKIEFYT